MTLFFSMASSIKFWLAISCCVLLGLFYGRGFVIELRDAEIVALKVQLSTSQRSLDELSALAEARREQIAVGEKEAAAIRAKSRSAVTRAQKVVIVGECVADMQQLATEAQK